MQAALAALNVAAPGQLRGRLKLPLGGPAGEVHLRAACVYDN